MKDIESNIGFTGNIDDRDKLRHTVLNLTQQFLYDEKVSYTDRVFSLNILTKYKNLFNLTNNF